MENFVPFVSNNCYYLQLEEQKKQAAAAGENSEKKKKKAAKQAAEKTVFVNKTPKGEKKGEYGQAIKEVSWI